jgi:hypothetical protein
MTTPAPPFRIACHVCQTEIDTSTEAPGDAQDRLRVFADASCPRGGVGCPNTTTALETQEEERPARLRQLVTMIRARAPRSARVALPALAAATPVEVPVTWQVAMPDATYSVVATPVVPAALLGVVRVAVKPGSLSPEGCALNVAATQAVAAGQAGLHVIGVP